MGKVREGADKGSRCARGNRCSEGGAVGVMHSDPGATRFFEHDAVGLGDFVHENTDESHGGAVAPATAPTNPPQQRGRTRRGGGGGGGLSCGNC